MSTLIVSPGPRPGGARPARPDRPVRLVRPARPIRPISFPHAPRPARTVVRLTRRGRLVVLLTALLLVLTAFVAGRAGAAAGTDAREVSRLIVVQPGQTLWSIAGQVAPGADRERTMSRIRKLNGLTQSGLQAGRRLAVPVR